MINFLKKKFSLIFIIIFISFSIQNIREFNDFGMINDDDKALDLLEDSKNFNLKNNENEINEFSENDLKKFELTKKVPFSGDNQLIIGENLNVANYTDTFKTTDVFVDEQNLNLSLVPVFETMLFSGVPEPATKPIPEKPIHYKTTTISVKNQKTLKLVSNNKNMEEFALHLAQHLKLP